MIFNWQYDLLFNRDDAQGKWFESQKARKLFSPSRVIKGIGCGFKVFTGENQLFAMNKSISTTSATSSRICFLTEGFYPDLGGIEKHSYQLSEKLVSKGQEVFVITRQSVVPSPDSEYVGNVFVTRIPPRGQLRGKGWQALFPVFFYLIRVFYILLKNVRRYDIILIIGFKTISIPAILVTMFTSKKSIVMPQSPIDLWQEISAESLERMGISSSSVLLKLLRRIRNPLIRRADSFVSISTEIRQELIGIGVNPKKIFSIPNGIDTEKFCPVSCCEKLEKRQRLSIPVNKVILIFTGRLTVSKGLLLLINVWNELVKEYENIHLLIVGAERDSHDGCEVELNEYIKLHNLKESLSLTGEVGNVHEYLQASDIFVFPSEYEGFGLSTVEALACALPSVVTKVGVASEIIQDRKNGLVINPKDRTELIESIKWLLHHKELWEKIGLNARRAVVGEYSMEAVADKYIQLFTELRSR